MCKNFGRWARAACLGASHPLLVTRRLWYNTKRIGVDGLSRIKYYNYPYNIIFLAGMAMSASTWMKNLLAGIPGYYTRPTPMPKDIAQTQNICNSAFSHVPINAYTLFKTHLNPTDENLECIFQNGVEKVLITYRDFRDVAVARYNRLIEYPKSPDANDFVDYRALGKERALNHSIEIVSTFYVSWIREWFAIAIKNPEWYHFVKFENLKKDTKGEFQKVLHFYGINLSDERIEKIIEAAKGRGNMVKNMEAAKILPWGYASNFRSGKIGSWRNELSNSHIEKCKKLLGSALVEFGYEKDLSW